MRSAQENIVVLVVKALCEVHKKQSIPRSKSTMRSEQKNKVFHVLKAPREVQISQEKSLRSAQHVKNFCSKSTVRSA